MLKVWGASAFHATDFYPGGGEFKRHHPDKSPIPERIALFERDSKRIPHIIGKYIHQLFVVSFRKDEFEAVAPADWRERFGGVHCVAAQLALHTVGFWAKKHNFEGRIAYFYETGDEEQGRIEEAYRKMYDNPDDREHCHMAMTPVGVPKGTVVVLRLPIS